MTRKYIIPAKSHQGLCVGSSTRAPQGTAAWIIWHENQAYTVTPNSQHLGFTETLSTVESHCLLTRDRRDSPMIVCADIYSRNFFFQNLKLQSQDFYNKLGIIMRQVCYKVFALGHHQVNDVFLLFLLIHSLNTNLWTARF